MRDGMVEIRETYYKRPDGSMWMRQQVGNRVLWEGPSPVFFVDWGFRGRHDPTVDDLNRISLRLVHRLLFVERSTSLVKEAPKAMVLYGR